MIGYVEYEVRGKKFKAVLGDDLKWKVKGDDITELMLNTMHSNTSPTVGWPGLYDLHHAAKTLKGKMVQTKFYPMTTDPRMLH